MILFVLDETVMKGKYYWVEFERNWGCPLRVLYTPKPCTKSVSAHWILFLYLIGDENLVDKMPNCQFGWLYGCKSL